jgi:peptidyl-prolyl cis-trans isomerase SurA
LKVFIRIGTESLLKKVFYAGSMLIVSAFSSVQQNVFAAKNQYAVQSEEYEGIVVVANEDIITARDLEERIRLMLFSIGQENSPKIRSQIEREVLREMIQQHLKWQCAKKFAPRGGWISDDEIKSAFSDIAKRINLNYDGFCKLLESRKINKDVLMQQIRTNLSWIAYINARFGRLVNISESEIKRTLALIKERENQESYYVHRMFFPVSDAKNEASVSARVNNIVHMLKQGADFGGLARQFSKSPDSAKGGEIGWVFQGQLSSEENSELKHMSSGSFKVVRNSRGYVILFLRNKREAGMQKFTTVKFVQVVIPFREPNPGKAEVAEVVNYLNEMKRNSRSCNDFIKRAKDSGFCGVSDPVVVALEEVQPEFRSIIASIPAGGIGNPISTPNSVVVVCVQDRKTEKIPEPTREDVVAQKANERLSVFADREMQDLYKKSSIKISEKYGSVLNYVK